MQELHGPPKSRVVTKKKFRQRHPYIYIKSLHLYYIYIKEKILARHMPVTLALGRLRQEDHSKFRLNYIAKDVSK